MVQIYAYFYRLDIHLCLWRKRENIRPKTVQRTTEDTRIFPMFTKRIVRGNVILEFILICTLILFKKRAAKPCRPLRRVSNFKDPRLISTSPERH